MAHLPDQVAVEQAALDVRYARLDHLRSETSRRLSAVRAQGPSGSPQNRSERDAFATLYEDRLAQLEGVEERLSFGRLDGPATGTLYIGRIGLTDQQHTVLLTDWRAPAARPFYQATAKEPMGVERRRHLFTRRREVAGIEDEALDIAALDPDSAEALNGEGALMAAMAAERTGRMSDIVATIQREQDAIVRAPLDGVLVVQGGPGTGKTAVALHRAAYLLYTHRERLERSGVLLIGPSQVFLRYIDRVLPSLGENGVVATTLAGLLPGVSARGTESPAVAAIKGRPVMARVIAQAVRLRQRTFPEPRHVRIEGMDFVIRPHDIETAQEHARRTGRPYNQARATFVREMLRILADRYEAGLDYPLGPDDRRDLIEELRSHREIRIALNLAWMPLTPFQLIEELFANPAILADAAPQLSVAERALLARPRGGPWTEADIPLLDEAADLLGDDDSAARARAREQEQRRAQELAYARQVLTTTGTPTVSAEMLADRFAASGPRTSLAERAAADRRWTYGHVLVDEAQELSPMAWRAVARRCPTRSMTLVGDLSQRHASEGIRDWATTAQGLARGRRFTLTSLSVNYRTPASIMKLAELTAQELGLPVAPLTSAREVPDAVVEIDDRDPVEACARVLALEVASERQGRMAVIAPEPSLAEIRARLGSHGLASLLAAPGGAELDARIALLSPAAAKGLEFDIVALLEPRRLAQADSGPADLYVAMTRPTQRLYLIEATRAG